MNTTSSNKTSKTPIIFLALLLVGTLIYSFKMYQDSEATALLLENEKIEVLKNLENMTSYRQIPYHFGNNPIHQVMINGAFVK